MYVRSISAIWNVVLGSQRWIGFGLFFCYYEILGIELVSIGLFPRANGKMLVNIYQYELG